MKRMAALNIPEYCSSAVGNKQGSSRATYGNIKQLPGFLYTSNRNFGNLSKRNPTHIRKIPKRILGYFIKLYHQLKIIIFINNTFSIINKYIFFKLKEKLK